MATPTGKTQCVRCGKERCTSKCAGCSKDFCRNHQNDHYQELTQQLDEIEANRDIFRESLAEQMKKLKENPLIQQIDIWKHDSIKKIQETAEAAKLLLSQRISEHYNQIEIKVNKLSKQLREIREENDFNEINLRQVQDELTRLNTEPITLPITSIPQDSWSCISNVHAKVSDLICLSSIKTQSELNMQHIKKMAAMESTLNTNHQEMDDSFRCRIQKISEKVSSAIGQVITDTQGQQSALLADANARMSTLEEEYKNRLQRYVGELDTVKAQHLTTLQRDLHLRHTMIFEQARKSLDDLYEEGNRSKMNILRENQAQMNARVENMNGHGTALNAEDTLHVQH